MNSNEISSLETYLYLYITLCLTGNSPIFDDVQIVAWNMPQHEWEEFELWKLWEFFHQYINEKSVHTLELISSSGHTKSIFHHDTILMRLNIYLWCDFLPAFQYRCQFCYMMEQWLNICFKTFELNHLTYGFPNVEWMRANCSKDFSVSKTSPSVSFITKYSTSCFIFLANVSTIFMLTPIPLCINEFARGMTTVILLINSPLDKSRMRIKQNIVKYFNLDILQRMYLCNVFRFGMLNWN